MDIHLLTFWIYIYYHFDTIITIWIDILQFGHIYCNLDINMETRHIYMTFQHIDPVGQAYWTYQHKARKFEPTINKTLY